MLLLLLLLLLCSLVSSSDCPSECSCQPHTSVFCFTRRSSSVPRVPSSTLKLYVFHNGISSLSSEDFHGLVQLQLLDLSQNHLTEVPDGVFETLTKLKNLDLSSNQITHISEGSFSGLVQLERLYLHANQIQSINTEAFQSLENLLELKLQGNQLISLPALSFTNLLLLDLSNNNIQALGPSDLQTPHLEALKVSSLGLTSLDENLIASLENLHYLDVSMNQLVELPQALKQDNLKGLLRLNLAGNPLGELKIEDFRKLNGLQELDLSGLNLQGIPQGFLQNFPKLAHLTAAENPFNCLCPLAWFSVWLKEKSLSLGRPEETRCHFPLVNAGKMLSELDVKDFGCPHTTTIIVNIESTSIAGIPTTPPDTPLSNTTQNSPALFQDRYTPTSDPPLSTHPPEFDHHMCPENICVNGGTCHFDELGQLVCLCPVGTIGLFCENKDESARPASTLAPAVVKPELDAITSRHVTATSILLDLHHFIQTQPHIRGIRLTYRNLSGPDHRPIIVRVPASYPEYTLRGLRPNCTYSVCASPLLERVNLRANSSVELVSCTEARTAVAPLTVTEPRMTTPGPVSDSLVPALAALALLMGVAVLVGVVICIRRRSKAKPGLELEVVSADAEDTDAAKTCADNSSTVSQKQPTGDPLPGASQQNGASLDFDVPLMQELYPSNNNLSSLKPLYF